VLYPWTHTHTAAPDRARYRAIGDRLASAMFAQHEKRYVLQSGADLYAASGTATDWAYGDAEALSFTIELRPGRNNSRRGFVLPPEEIKPTCDEGFAAARVAGASATACSRTSRSPQVVLAMGGAAARLPFFAFAFAFAVAFAFGSIMSFAENFSNCTGSVFAGATPRPSSFSTAANASRWATGPDFAIGPTGWPENFTT
jgi:hypothetical protein